MIETAAFLLGIGFSVLVYYRSIRPAPVSAVRKLLYFILSLTGITGMLFLFGIMASFVLSGRK
ncbi:MAG TPA: hypothetical protein VN604_03215 [Nitrospirota bacterium]|nr:hypothetical protein [Nitrospirota bacterium]